MAILGCTGFTILEGRAGKDACTTVRKTAFLRQAPGSIGRQVLRRYSFDSDWVYRTLKEKHSESLSSTLPAIVALPLAVMPAISFCWRSIPSA